MWPARGASRSSEGEGRRVGPDEVAGGRRGGEGQMGGRAREGVKGREKERREKEGTVGRSKDKQMSERRARKGMGRETAKDT